MLSRYLVSFILFFGISAPAWAVENISRISISEAGALIAAQQEYTLSFRPAVVRVDIIKADKTNVFAEASSVQEYVTAIRSVIPSSSLKTGSVTLTRGWNLLTADNGVVVYDIAPYFEDIFKNAKTTEPSDGEEYHEEDYGSNYVLLSAVGPYVSYVGMFAGYGGGAHPFASRNFGVKNIQTGLDVKLTELATEADILQALEQDTFLKKALTVGLDDDGPARPNAYKKFLATKNLQEVDQILSDNIQSCRIFWGHGAADEFAIYDYDIAKNKMSIRVGLRYGCEVMRGNLTQLGLLLTPRSSELVSALKSAKTKRDGLLLINNKEGQDASRGF